jgi:hypothetical protein
MKELMYTIAGSVFAFAGTVSFARFVEVVQ